MSGPRHLDPKLVIRVRAALGSQVTDANALHTAQAILLPGSAHATLEQTDTLLGVIRASVA